MMRAWLLLLAVAGCGGSTPTRPAPVHADGASANAPAHHAHDRGHDPAHGHHQAGAHAPGGHSGGGMHHRFENAEAWAKVFDDPARDAWQQPDRVIAALELAPTMTVADIGAGTGYFTVRIARAVPKGTVIATDLEADMVRYLRERAQREGLTNVRAVATSSDDPQLATASVDRVLVVDVWHHLGDRAAYARKLAAALAPGGLVAVVDFKLDAKLGPPRQHRLAPDAIIADLAAAGLTASVALELPEQYVVIGRRAER